MSTISWVSDGKEDRENEEGLMTGHLWHGYQARSLGLPLDSSILSPFPFNQPTIHANTPTAHSHISPPIHSSCACLSSGPSVFHPNCYIIEEFLLVPQHSVSSSRQPSSVLSPCMAPHCPLREEHTSHAQVSS